jgi:NADH:ubiquinone oxidoreductase subunit 4 (subunit M)
VPDLSLRETVLATVMVIGIIALGLFPRLVLAPIQPAVLAIHDRAGNADRSEPGGVTP